MSLSLCADELFHGFEEQLDVVSHDLHAKGTCAQREDAQHALSVYAVRRIADVNIALVERGHITELLRVFDGDKLNLDFFFVLHLETLPFFHVGRSIAHLHRFCNAFL